MIKLAKSSKCLVILILLISMSCIACSKHMLSFPDYLRANDPTHAGAYAITVKDSDSCKQAKETFNKSLNISCTVKETEAKCNRTKKSRLELWQNVIKEECSN